MKIDHVCGKLKVAFDDNPTDPSVEVIRSDGTKASCLACPFCYKTANQLRQERSYEEN